MRLKIMLIISAVYMALIGIGHLVSPVSMSAGVVPSDASVGMVAFLRHYSALFLAIAVMNWLARNAEASTARNAIIIANILIFVIGAILDYIAVLIGAGIVGLIPGTMNLILAGAFFWAGRTNISSK